jgi:hypothetical protein
MLTMLARPPRSDQSIPPGRGGVHAMRMSGAVIELGLAEPWEPEPSSPTRWPPRVPGWLLPVAVVAATLLAVTGAAPPHRWDPVLAIGDTNSGLWFGPDDTAYVTTQRSRSTRLQAHRLGRKGALWTVNILGGYPVPITQTGSGLPLMVFDTDPSGRGGNQVQEREAKTGALVWSRSGMGLVGLGPDVTVVSDRQEVGGPVPGPSGEVEAHPGVLEAVDRRTGRSRWTRQVPPDVLVGSTEMGVTRDGPAPMIIELSTDGRLRLSDASTGATRREARFALVGRPLSIYLSDHQAIVYQQPPAPAVEQLSVTYDLISGAELSRQNTSTAAFCSERYLCVSEPGQLTVTDLASGAVRFHGHSEQHLIDGDRLIVSWEPRWPEPAGTEVYDLRTGRRLNAYPGWRVANFDSDTVLLALDLSGGGALVAVRDDHTGHLTVAGRAKGWTGTMSCTRGTRFFGCVGVSGLRVWRLPATDVGG